MINQPYSVHLSIASSAEIEHTARQLKTTREQFLTTGVLPQQSLRPIILESWRRCHTLQVNPSLCYAPLAITHEAQLTQLREANQLLMRAAGPAMSYLSDFLADSGYVIVLSDSDGCLLEVIGDARTRRRLARIDFVPGGDWSEAAAGTNAPGTAIADGHVVQLLGAEHYCTGWQDLTCTAAPIRHPLSGEIMGTLDVTGDYRLIRPFLSSFIAAMALQIQHEMRSLLTSSRKGKSQKKFSIVPFSVSSETSSPKLGMYTHQQQAGEDAYRTSTGDGMYSLPRIRERRAHTATLLAAALSAISASLDVDITLEKVAEQIAHLLRLESASVCLFGESNEIVLLHTWSRQYVGQSKFRHDLDALLRQSTVISLVRERGEPIVLDDVLTSRFLPATLSEPLGIRSLLLLPLTTARGAIGFILAPKRTCYHWIVDDVLLGLSFAVHAATAIENARLFTIKSEMEALREADRLKREFIVAVSHDLQSPLTAIRASVEGLLDQGVWQSAQMHERLLENIAGQASRLERLIDQLLDLTRIEAGVLSLDRDWIELPVLIADTLTKFEELHRGWSVERDLAADLPLQYVDPDRFAQVLWNLLENAKKYASSCTAIKVEARWTSDGVLVEVADRGPGIPVEERKKIFQHFYRLKRDRGTHTQGSGLGLAICQGIVQAHGGRIWVEDEPGGGSVFRFILPPPTASLTEPEPLDLSLWRRQNDAV
jgi:signal transduction histidine kinase